MLKKRPRNQKRESGDVARLQKRRGSERKRGDSKNQGKEGAQGGNRIWRGKKNVPEKSKI